jgi:hypothetical protein
MTRSLRSSPTPLARRLMKTPPNRSRRRPLLVRRILLVHALSPLGPLENHGLLFQTALELLAAHQDMWLICIVGQSSALTPSSS